MNIGKALKDTFMPAAIGTAAFLFTAKVLGDIALAPPSITPDFMAYAALGAGIVSASSFAMLGYLNLEYGYKTLYERVGASGLSVLGAMTSTFIYADMALK